ncbi:MAG: helix-turn-helix transcriptional regulator [Bacteroidales bacterium]|nr:helix-turn-helix transcriptional regulator [Bacteroidales bacterium]MBQ9711595.1 helix-turn-helix transcriptional regulator [Bacteroidales bacterium]
MNKATAVIERGGDGKYSIFIEEKNYPYGIIGTGATVKEAIEDFNIGYMEVKEYAESTGIAFEETEFTFKYDVPSFLQEYAYAFTLAGLERITGINQKQLGHYISGYRKPSEKTVRKIEAGIHAFSNQLKDVQFVI